jgi:polyisoprenoid-binding protein YceI
MPSLIRSLAAGLVLAAALPALAGDPPAAKAPSGQSLVVPEAHQKLGTVYYAIPGRDRQVYFISDAPVEKIKGQSNKVIGYAVAAKDNPADLKAGEWHLPVNSLRTGNGTRDKHLTQANWLNAESFPDVIFVLRQVKDLKSDKSTKASTGTLVGEMTIHGVTKPVSIENATIAAVPESERTAKGLKGDLLAIRANYPIALADYGVKNQAIGGKVAEKLALETTLYLSTIKPEDQPAPKSEGGTPTGG